MGQNRAAGAVPWRVAGREDLGDWPYDDPTNPSWALLEEAPTAVAALEGDPAFGKAAGSDERLSE